jgi:5-methyltetrahydrofolate--homocysteine methyltransferase
MPQPDSLAESLADCQEERVQQLVREKLAAGVSADRIVAECNQGMLELGNRFVREECFIPDLMFGGMLMKTVMAELGPRLAESQAAHSVGTAVMGSVQHDIHDIGKDIVVMMLRGSGFEVVDLGVDVPPERFVEAIRQHHPAVIGLSVLLTTCYKSVIATVEAIRQAGLRDQVKVMVGGAAASGMLSSSSGCDFYGKTAVDGVTYAREVVAAA